MNFIMKLNKEPYKGTRDFYPEDQFVHNHVFHAMKQATHAYGYEEYNSTMLEETALYAAKTGEEIVKEQTYSFVDRGNREVTIRPEMTPTFARMIAKKNRELALPARWYSYPNLFRYERPQRGRLREHWQLNVDIAGEKSLGAEAELISLGAQIMKNLGAGEGDFIVSINSRRLLNSYFKDILKLKEEDIHRLSKLVDKKNKIPKEVFIEQAEAILGGDCGQLLAFFDATHIQELEAVVGIQFFQENVGIAELSNLLQMLVGIGITQARFDPTIMRGFDYYTGIVFEFYDTHAENNRALFGGGRYDDLVGIFGVEPITCVGFGMGDVTARDFLEVRGLIPQYSSSADVHLCLMDGVALEDMMQIAQVLRGHGVTVSMSMQPRKIAKQIQEAEKKSIPNISVVGIDEVESQVLTVKNLLSGNETKAPLDKVHTLL